MPSKCVSSILQIKPGWLLWFLISNRKLLTWPGLLNPWLKIILEFLNNMKEVVLQVSPQHATADPSGKKNYLFRGLTCQTNVKDKCSLPILTLLKAIIIAHTILRHTVHNDVVLFTFGSNQTSSTDIVGVWKPMISQNMIILFFQHKSETK